MTTNISAVAALNARTNSTSGANATAAGEIPARLGDGFSDGFGGVFEIDFMPASLSGPPRMSLCALYVAVVVLGLGGNALVLLVIAVNRDMRTVTNVFLVSLAVSDALIAGINMPLHLRLFLQVRREVSRTSIVPRVETIRRPIPSA